MLKILDLFCGCGGLSLGFKKAKYKIEIGIDINESYLQTFSHNFPESKTLKADLSNGSFLKKISYTDIMVAGPPCQGFSITGPRQIEDSRNKLYLAVFKALKLLKPKAFLIENVRGLMSMWNGKVFEEILKKFENEGYNISHKLINSADYGVPQIRHRIFIIGIKKKINRAYAFPREEFSKNDYLSCEEAIGDLPGLENEHGKEEMPYAPKPKTDYQKYVMDSSLLYNHVATNHKDFVKKVIAMVPEGGNYKDLPKGVGGSRTFHEAWTRYHSKKPSRTIDTGHRNHFHYKWNRIPTIRENARLQSFKDSFRFFGNRTSQNFQVGNAVPPLLAYKLALKLKEILGEKN